MLNDIAGALLIIAGVLILLAAYRVGEAARGVARAAEALEDLAAAAKSAGGGGRDCLQRVQVGDGFAWRYIDATGVAWTQGGDHTAHWYADDGSVAAPALSRTLNRRVALLRRLGEVN